MKIKLGFKPDEKDERDLQFGAVMGVPPASMPSWEKGYNVEDDIPIGNDHQGRSLGCVSFGSTSDVETAYRAITGKEVKLSQRWIYSRIHLRNGGSSPRSAYKLLQKEGVCEDSFMPTNPSKSLTEASMRSESMRQGARENASKYKIGKYYSISPYKWDEYIQAIYQNKGCGFGYMTQGNMGHFVFGIGYKLINGNQTIVYHDSYSPYTKHIIKKGNKFYKETGQQIQLYSAWTAENGDWEINMETKLVRKKKAKEVFLLVNGKRYWLKEAEDLKNLNAGGLIGSWEDVEEVDILPGTYTGKIIGTVNFTDLLKNLFGVIQ